MTSPLDFVRRLPDGPLDRQDGWGSNEERKAENARRNEEAQQRGRLQWAAERDAVRSEEADLTGKANLADIEFRDAWETGDFDRAHQARMRRDTYRAALTEIVTPTRELKEGQEPR
jgi:hypothetical protein